MCSVINHPVTSLIVDRNTLLALRFQTHVIVFFYQSKGPLFTVKKGTYLATPLTLGTEVDTQEFYFETMATVVSPGLHSGSPDFTENFRAGFVSLK